MANDIFSMAREGVAPAGAFNLPTLIAAERHCSLQEAVDLSVAHHARVVRAFEAEHQRLVAVRSPELQRFLLGLRAWIGGSGEWHAGSGRYRTGSVA
jgi:2-methylisoborneol synthase